MEQVAAPGASASLHRHPYQEVFYVLEGELEFVGGGAETEGARVTFAVAAGLRKLAYVTPPARRRTPRR